MKTKLIVAVAVAGTLIASVADAQTRRRSAPPQRSAQPSQGYGMAPAAARGHGHRMAGCGLGSMVVEDSGKWSQVAASFLNGTGMQTFAISFGTSNCVEDGVAAAGKEREIFVEANLEDLQRDVAAGEGEYLASAMNLYGCEGPSAQSFQQALQQSKKEFLEADAELAGEMLATAAVSCKAEG